MNFSGRYLVKVILCKGTVDYLNNSLSIFSEDANTTDGTVRGTGKEASLGASGSSGAEWIGVERGGGLTPLTPLGGDLRRVQNVVTFNLRGTEPSVQHSRCSGIGTPPPNNE